jgi:hypothetical protein
MKSRKAKYKEDWLSETEAADMMNVKDNAAFYRLFVRTGRIKAIIFPTQVRRRYLKRDVEALKESLKVDIPSELMETRSINFKDKVHQLLGN